MVVIANNLTGKHQLVGSHAPGAHKDVAKAVEGSKVEVQHTLVAQGEAALEPMAHLSVANLQVEGQRVFFG